MEKDIGRITKNPQTEIVIRLDDFGGKNGLTIREFVTSDRYTGFTKAGVRIQAADFAKFKEMINSIDENDLTIDAPVEEEPSEEAPVVEADQSIKQKAVKEETEEKPKEESNPEELPDY